jgi:hypothetical protein
MSLPASAEAAYLGVSNAISQRMGVSVMLKQLNGIAAGLLGLHGYPVEPISSLATRRSSTLADPAAGRRPVAPLATEAAARKQAPFDDALHC